MSNFLHSSPSRQTIDPLMYSFPEAESNTKPSKSKKKTSKGKDTPISTNTGNLNPTQNTIPSSVPPSAQKLYSGGIPTGITGWTPLISKTIFSDQLISYTPNSKWPGIPVGSSSNLNITTSNTNNNNNPNVGGNEDFQGLSLTPFLNHNLHSGFGSGMASANLNQMTPFHDKSLHLADFFMDSPIRQTPLKDLDTITPSKFKIHSTEKSSVRKLIFQDSRRSGNDSGSGSSSNKVKRSITQVDTPPRQPYKLSNLSISANADEGGEGDDENDEDEDASDDDSDRQIRLEGDHELSEAADKPMALREIKQSYFNQQTPSKSKSDRKNQHTNNNNNFLTPHKPISASSPSTVIMSSAYKSPAADGVDLMPPSPTPKKDSSADSAKAAPCKQIIDGDDFKPAMGVFSGSKKLPQQKPKAIHRGISSESLTSTGPDGKKSQNKAQMQAGMNKFQIVFTDMHTLMNGKGKKKEKKKKEAQNQNLQQHQQTQKQHQHPQNIPQQHPQQLPGRQPVVAPAAEISLMSINNNSMNTSHLNMSSTDHSSFELGGTSSTPNSKYFLDKMFEKPSPGQGNKIQQLLMQQQYAYYPTQQQVHLQQQQPQQQQHMFGNMPPPQTSGRPLSSSQQQQNMAQQNPMMMMMMSTPQHQKIIYNGYGPNGEPSPNLDTQNSGDAQYTAFSCQALQGAFPKDQGEDSILDQDSRPN